MSRKLSLPRLFVTRGRLGLALLGIAVVAVIPAAQAATIYDVVAYGAKCDGVTDDTSAMQAAIDAAEAAGGGVVTVPTGTCMLTGDLTIDGSGVTLEGSGQEATVLMRMAGTYSTHGMIIKLKNATDLRVRDLTLDGNKTNVTGSQEGLSISSTTATTIEHVTVRDFKYGTQVSGNQSMTFQNCRFTGNTNNPVLFRSSDDARFQGNYFGGTAVRFVITAPVTSHRIVFTENTFDGDSSVMLEFPLALASDVVINDNTFHGSLSITRIGNVVISGNTIRAKDSAPALGVQGTVGPVTIEANEIINEFGQGIQLTGLGSESDISVRGNNLRVNGEGITVRGRERVSVVGNTISIDDLTNSNVGIFVLGKSQAVEGVLIADNLVGNFNEGISVEADKYGVDTISVTGNLIRSQRAGASGVTISDTLVPNSYGKMVTNVLEAANLFVQVP